MLQVTQDQSWKCPKCIEEDLLKRNRNAKILSDRKASIGTTASKRKNLHPKKVITYKKFDTDSDSDSSTATTKSKTPKNKKTQLQAKKKPTAKKESSSEDSTDVSSDEEEDDDSGKIIRIPVDRSEVHKYYK